MGKKKTKAPSLAVAPSLSNPGLVERWMRSVTEILNVGQGIRGDKLDRNLTLRDIQDFDTLPHSVRRGVSGGIGDELGVTGSEKYTQPPIVTGLAAEGGYSFIHLHWDIIEYSFFAHVEIWRSATDDFGTATMIGTTSSQLFVDEVGAGSGPLYYWVKVVSTRGDTGQVNQTSGTLAQTSLDPSYVINTISGLISRSDLHASLNSDIGVLEGDTGDLLNSYVIKLGANNTVAGFGIAQDIIDGNPVSNFIIHADNFAVGYPGQANAYPFVVGTVNGFPAIGMNASTYILDLTVTDAKIQSLKADKLFVDSGYIATAIIGAGHIDNAMIGSYIRSYSYVAGSSGWNIDKNGTAEFRNITARGNIEATSIKAGTVNIIDTLMLQGQAVTIPVSTRDSSTRLVFNDTIVQLYRSGNTWYNTSWVTVDSITFTSSGAPLTVFASAWMELVVNSADTSVINNSTTVKYNVTTRLSRGGTAVTVVEDFFSFRVSVSDDENGHNVYINVPDTKEAIKIFNADTPGSGAVTYNLEVRLEYYIDKPQSDSLYHNIDVKTHDSVLTVLETKR